MTKKVYLSKSNLADPVIYGRVRAILNELDCEIKEYNGQPDESQVIASDILIIVPPSTVLRDVKPRFQEGGAYHVGKGQFVYVDAFIENNANFYLYDDDYHMEDIDYLKGKTVLRVTEVESTQFYVDEVTRVAKTEINWRDKFAELEGDETYQGITAFVDWKPAPVKRDQPIFSGNFVKLPIDTSNKLSHKEAVEFLNKLVNMHPMPVYHLACASYLGII